LLAECLAYGLPAGLPITVARPSRTFTGVPRTSPRSLSERHDLMAVRLRRMRVGVATLATVTAVLAGLVAAPGALGTARPCRAGAVTVKLAGRAKCVARRLALPAPAKTAPGLAQLQGALRLTQVGLKGHAGRHVAPLSQRVGRSWTTARSRMLRAMSATFARIAKPLR